MNNTATKDYKFKDHLIDSAWTESKNSTHVSRMHRIDFPETVCFSIANVAIWIRFFDYVVNAQGETMPYFEFLLKQGDREFTSDHILIKDLDKIKIDKKPIIGFIHFFEGLYKAEKERSYEPSIHTIDFNFNIFHGLRMSLVSRDDEGLDFRCFIHFCNYINIDSDISDSDVFEIPFSPKILYKAAQAADSFNEHIHQHYDNY